VTTQHDLHRLYRDAWAQQPRPRLGIRPLCLLGAMVLGLAMWAVIIAAVCAAVR
jgi:hypothetical protein